MIEAIEMTPPLQELPHRAGFLLIDSGVTDYATVYETQKELVDRRKTGRSQFDYLVLVEHPSVYTYGRKSQAADGSINGPLGESVFAVERGGEVTYHNPGQLVAYPILYLNKGPERDLHLHLRRMEHTVIDVLADFGIAAEQREGATGVWVQGKNKKIASIGVAVSGWVTYHGCALNVCNDLKGFQKINPCGFQADVMTSMKVELGPKCPSLSEVKESFVRHFSRHFDRGLVV